MAEVERRASSTRRGPSTPTAPDSEGMPPRRAMRNSLSQRLSRLEIMAGSGEEERGELRREGMGESLQSKLSSPKLQGCEGGQCRRFLLILAIPFEACRLHKTQTPSRRSSPVIGFWMPLWRANLASFRGQISKTSRGRGVATVRDWLTSHADFRHIPARRHSKSS